MATIIQGPTSIRETMSNAYFGDDWEFSGVNTIDIQLPNDRTDDYMIRFQIEGGDQIERYITAGDGYQIPAGRGVTVLFNVKAIAATTPDADIAVW